MAALSEQFPEPSLAVVASGHERPVPLFQQFPGSDPAGRDDVREVPAVASTAPAEYLSFRSPSWRHCHAATDTLLETR